MLLTSAGSALSVELSSAEWVVGLIPVIGPIKVLKSLSKKLLPLPRKCLHFYIIQLSAFVLETFTLTLCCCCVFLR